MEVTTCERYVLAELEAKRRECEGLEERLAEVTVERDGLKARAEKPCALEAEVTAAGRASVFGSRTWACITRAVDGSGDEVPFRAWCEDAVRGCAMPGGVSKAEFIEFFEPEFRRAYDDQVESGRAALAASAVAR